MRPGETNAQYSSHWLLWKLEMFTGTPTMIGHCSVPIKTMHLFWDITREHISAIGRGNTVSAERINLRPVRAQAANYC